MIWLFLFHPASLSGIAGTAIVLIFCIIFGVFGFILYAQYRQKKGRPVKGVTVTDNSGTSKVPEAFVGMTGRGVCLRVRHADGALRVSLSPYEYTLIIAVCFLFGPGMIGAYLAHHSTYRFNGPWLALAGIAAMTLISTWMFLRYLRIALLRMPMVEVTPEGIRLWRGRTQEAVIWRRDISGLALRASQFLENGRSYDNYTLCALLAGGGEKGLCITDIRIVIEDLKSAMERMLNLG